MKLFSWGSFGQISSFFYPRCTQLIALEEGLLFFLQVRATKDLGVAVRVSSFFVNPRFLTGFLTPGTMGVYQKSSIAIFFDRATVINSLG